MIGRADIEGSKSYVAMNAWQPQASYPCGNFSDNANLEKDAPAKTAGILTSRLNANIKKGVTEDSTAVSNIF